MSYIYRYDPWLTHLRMHGDMLRARRWSSGEAGPWQHEPLVAAEHTLAEGESIFRISFWKSLEAAKSRMGCRLWSQLHVLQRVREDHPFFNAFERADDDFLIETAWLFWQASPREPQQDWSRDGIPKSDIEILDLDGQWRTMPESTLMASSHARYTRRGFEPHYFMTHGAQPAVVYWTSRLLRQRSGDTDVALLLAHPQESCIRIYNDPAAIQAIVDRFLASGSTDIPAERLRLFIVDEGRHTFESSHVLEIPLCGHWREATPSGSGSLRWLRPRRNVRYEYVVKVKAGTEDWRRHSFESDPAIAVLSVFEFPTLEQNLSRYVAALEGAREDAATGVPMVATPAPRHDVLSA
ncbi:hypothetical protein G3A43_11115 [Paraburkholderia aspalathi]|uniref:hypothetical protein n=1 Tax=Paraburkholderia nemoris TaxID=2793076 RepID=UPI0019098F2C|nr:MULTISPECIES: hypothetical protein [Paraburkholderia]MBK3780777.1 hypothetical protein [Paraburkholderia aspalathi]